MSGSIAMAPGATSGGATSGGNASADNAIHNNRSDRGFDWGWLGLIGLAGLIPLFLHRNGHQSHAVGTNTANNGRGY